MEAVISSVQSGGDVPEEKLTSLECDQWRSETAPLQYLLIMLTYLYQTKMSKDALERSSTRLIRVTLLLLESQ